MTDGTPGDEQEHVAADCPNERLVSDEVIDGIIDEMALKQKLQKLSNEELVKKAVTDYTDWTWHPVIEVMMDRLSPGWEGTDEDDG